MLDIKLIREQPEVVRAALEKRHSAIALEPLLAMDERRRAAITQADQLKQERNEVSRKIGELKKAGQDTAEIQARTRELGEQIAGLDAEVRQIEEEQRAMALGIPNCPHASTPVGASAADNVVVREWGEKRTFDFEPKDHIALGESLGLFDFARAARMTGAGFPLFTGAGARLERALIQFMLDLHTTAHGYTEISPPFVVNTASMTGTGQLPKMAEDMYHVPNDGLWLIPTAEVPVTNMHRDEIIRAPLPLKYVAYTPCFRREAGSAGKETRGLIRVHQFDKVELVKFVAPGTSYDELEQLVGDATDVLETLGLTYRVLQLCSGDMSFAAAKCYDLELWAPGHGGWLEVSSCSNFEAFQARRAGIRYRENPKAKPQFAHTLNGSGVAVGRTVAAILENYQNEDGTVTVPEVLRPYMGTDIIK